MTALNLEAKPNNSFLAMIGSGWTITGKYIFPGDAPKTVKRDWVDRGPDFPSECFDDPQYSLRGNVARSSWEIARYLYAFKVDEVFLFTYAAALMQSRVLHTFDSLPSKQLAAVEMTIKGNVFRKQIGHAMYALGSIDIGVEYLNQGDPFTAAEYFMTARAQEMYIVLSATADEKGAPERGLDAAALARSELGRMGAKARHEKTAPLKSKALEMWNDGAFPSKAAGVRWVLTQKDRAVSNARAIEKWFPKGPPPRRR